MRPLAWVFPPRRWWRRNRAAQRRDRQRCSPPPDPNSSLLGSCSARVRSVGDQAGEQAVDRAEHAKESGADQNQLENIGEQGLVR